MVEKMSRDEIIHEMCEVVNDMNRQMAAQNGVPQEQVDQVIVNMQQELMYGNSLILDKLIELDLIKVDY